MKRLTCKQVSTAFARGDYDDAPPFTLLRVRFHLLICWHCRRFKRQLNLIALAMRTHVFPAADPARTAALEQVILARLKGGNGI